MGACASKPKDLDTEQIPPVAPVTPRKQDPETQENEKAGETKKEEPVVEPSDLDAEAPNAEEVAATDIVPEAETSSEWSEKEETAQPAKEAVVDNKPTEAITEGPVEEEEDTIVEVVIDKTETTTTTEEEIKTEVPVVKVHCH